MESHELIQSGDCTVWAREFTDLYGLNSWQDKTDEELEGLMQGWFANAIETGKRIGREQTEAQLLEFCDEQDSNAETLMDPRVTGSNPNQIMVNSMVVSGMREVTRELRERLTP